MPLTASLAQAAYNPAPRPAWNPTSGRVYAMARVGNVVVLGGSFTALWSPVDGTTVARNRLAAVDATTGELLPWNPNSNGEVRVLEGSADGSTVYVGGAFTSIGGVAKSRLAAVTVPTGAVVTGFTANAAATVTALELSGPTLYVGGYFTTLGGKPRQRLAAVDAGTGALSTTFTGSADGAVRSILASPGGTTLAVGGEFATLSGSPRAFLGSVTLTGQQPPGRRPRPAMICCCRASSGTWRRTTRRSTPALRARAAGSSPTRAPRGRSVGSSPATAMSKASR